MPRAAGDAINAAGQRRCPAHAAANRRQADGEAGADGGEGGDPDGAIGRVGGLELREEFAARRLEVSNGYIQVYHYICAYIYIYYVYIVYIYIYVCVCLSLSLTELQVCEKVTS